MFEKLVLNSFGTREFYEGYLLEQYQKNCCEYMDAFEEINQDSEELMENELSYEVIEKYVHNALMKLSEQDYQHLCTEGNVLNYIAEKVKLLFKFKLYFFAILNFAEKYDILDKQWSKEEWNSFLEGMKEFIELGLISIEEMKTFNHLL